MIEYKTFKGLLNSWNGEEHYQREKQELDKQINLLISLQSGMGQSSQGQPEDWKHMFKMQNEIYKLGISIKTALGIL